METVNSQRIPVEKAALLSGKSLSNIRQLKQKKKLKHKTINRKLHISKQSLEEYYSIKIEDNLDLKKEPVNSTVNTVEEPVNSSSEISLIKQNTLLKEEKIELLDKFIEAKKIYSTDLIDFDKTISNKNKIIEEKDDKIDQIRTEKNAEIEKKGKIAGIFFILSIVSTIFLAVAVFYIYEVL